MEVVALSKSGVEEDIADGDYWRELADVLGWRVYGWTHRHVCTYLTSNRDGGFSLRIKVTGSQRDSIMAVANFAIRKLGIAKVRSELLGIKEAGKE